MISGVISVSGDSLTIRKEIVIEATTPQAMEKMARRMALTSRMLSEKPISMIGPISGEINMAPMMTAGEESNRPSVAMAQDMTAMKM